MWGFGTLTPVAGWAATGRPLDAGHALVLLGFCPLFAGLYPLTQLYQMEEDRRRGDRTLALLVGLRASLGVAIACTALAFALFGWAAVVLGVRGSLLVVPLVAWVAVLVPWYRRREALPAPAHQRGMRSEEHTSELQSQSNLVCRLLLEKKKKKGNESKVALI